MTSRADIGKGRLVYTCNCGWIDRGHLNPHPPRNTRTGSNFISATNLWRQLKKDGNESPTECGFMSRAFGATNCGSRKRIHFPTGDSGYKVTYRQDMGVKGIYVGTQKSYLVRKNLTDNQRKSVALAIFLEVSHGFENMQEGFPFNFVTNSGYSQEDLVSNLFGFFIAIGELSENDIMKKCHPISISGAEKLWDINGSVGSHKNRKPYPQLLDDTSYTTVELDSCGIKDECSSEPSKFPFAKLFQDIPPAKRGVLYKSWPKNNAPPFTNLGYR